jgi:hypothetical protein
MWGRKKWKLKKSMFNLIHTLQVHTHMYVSNSLSLAHTFKMHISNVSSSLSHAHYYMHRHSLIAHSLSLSHTHTLFWQTTPLAIHTQTLLTCNDTAHTHLLNAHFMYLLEDIAKTPQCQGIKTWLSLWVTFGRNVVRRIDVWRPDAKPT